MPEENAQLPPRIPRLGWAIAFLVAVMVFSYAFTQLRQIRPQISSRLDKIAPAPEFQMQAQDGSTVTTADLKGKVWVVNFIFTRCAGPCPVMTSRMAELSRSLGRKATDVQLVTVTVDPEHDTVPVLKTYSEKVGAQPEKWLFLTGNKDDLEKVVSKGFLQPLAKDEGGQPVHSTRFVLVDKEGWMRGFQDGNDPEVVQKLLMDIGDVLRESSAGGKN